MYTRFVDLVNRGVLTFVGDIRHYRNSRCYYSKCDVCFVLVSRTEWLDELNYTFVCQTTFGSTSYTTRFSVKEQHGLASYTTRFSVKEQQCGSTC